MRTNAIRAAISIAVLAVTTSAAAGATRKPDAASGLAINVPVVARLTGAGNTQYISTVDVTNHSSATRVDFLLDGSDAITGETIVRDGSISGSGALVERGAGSPMTGEFTAHYNDFIDALIQAGMLPESLRANGFLGSVMFVFDGFTQSGQASATVRFFNPLSGGTVGVSLKGHEMTVSEPQRLVAAVVDTRGNVSGEPQVYPNLFINNTGMAANGSGPGGTIQVSITAKSNGTGSPVGVPVTTTIGPGRTVALSQVLQALQVPPSAGDKVLVYVTVTSGDASIAGVISQVDAVTRDGAVFEMSRADF